MLAAVGADHPVGIHPHLDRRRGLGHQGGPRALRAVFVGGVVPDVGAHDRPERIDHREPRGDRVAVLQDLAGLDIQDQVRRARLDDRPDAAVALADRLREHDLLGGRVALLLPSVVVGMLAVGRDPGERGPDAPFVQRRRLRLVRVAWPPAQHLFRELAEHPVGRQPPAPGSLPRVRVLLELRERLGGARRPEHRALLAERGGRRQRRDDRPTPIRLEGPPREHAGAHRHREGDRPREHPGTDRRALPRGLAARPLLRPLVHGPIGR